MPRASRALASQAAVRSIPNRLPAANRTLGWSVLEWTARWLRQPDGPNAGEHWSFTGEQLGIVLRWYQIDGHGKFAYRRGVLRRMKGWGKDPFAAAIAAVELCGPCRFGGWAAGEPLAVPHPAPWVQVAAVSQDQTRNTMTLFPALLSKEAVREYSIDLGKTIIYARGNGRIEAVTSSPRALEGGRPTCVIKNESHHWILANEGIEMDQAITRNQAKSNDGASRSLEITNAHLPGEDSVAERTYEAWRAADGKVPGLYYDSLEASPIVSLMDVQAVRAGLVAARGDSTWLNVDRLLEEIADPVTPEWMSRRFYLNQVVAVEGERWMPMDRWDLLARPDRRIPDRADVILAFDGSFNGDSTAIVAVELGEIPHIEVVRCWENATGDREWRVPIEDVEDELRAAAKRFRVREIAADAYRWARSLELLAKERLPVVEFPQRPARMIPATTRMYEAVCNEGLTHDGSPDLRRHVANAVLKVSSQGGYLTKDAKWSPRRIDLAVTAVMAIERSATYEPCTARVIDLSAVMDDEDDEWDDEDDEWDDDDVDDEEDLP